MSAIQPVAIIPVPAQRLFTIGAAANYLGIDMGTLKKLTDQGIIPAKRSNQRRVYTLEALDRYIDSLPEWSGGSMPPAITPKRNVEKGHS